MRGCCITSSELFCNWVTDLYTDLSVMNIFKDKVDLINWYRHFTLDLNTKCLINESHESFLAIWLLCCTLVYLPFKLWNQYFFIKLYKFRELPHWMLLIEISAILHQIYSCIHFLHAVCVHSFDLINLRF